MQAAGCGRECWRCMYGQTGCVKGHEMDAVTPATESQLLWRLQERKWRADRQRIVQALEEINDRRGRKSRFVRARPEGS